MNRPFVPVTVFVTLLAAAAACAVRPPPPTEPTTTTSAPYPASHRTPASPAETWSTQGGPASPGVPSGSVVDPKAEPVRDGGVR